MQESEAHAYSQFLKGIPSLNTIDFNFNTCVFTGNPVNSSDEQVAIFPENLVAKYKLETLRLGIDRNHQLNISELKLPISKEAQDKGVTYLLRAIADMLALGKDGLNWLKPEQLHHYCLLLQFAVYYNTQNYYQNSEGPKPNFLSNAQFLNRVQILHWLMQVMVRKAEFINYRPSSVFTFECFDYPEWPGDISVSNEALCLHLRLGNLSIMSSALDHHLVGGFFDDLFTPFMDQVLHPIQLDELYVRICYRTSLIRPLYEVGVTLDEETICYGFKVDEAAANEEIFYPWEDEQFAIILRPYLLRFGLKSSEIFNPDTGELITFLEDEFGEPLAMNMNGEFIG